MSIVIDVETRPIPMNQLSAENKAYLEEKSKNKRSGKIIDGENYGNGAIGRFELSQIICCCVKIDDRGILSYTGEEKPIIKAVFKLLVGQDHIIGFNSNSFDFKMLKMRGIVNGISTTVIPFNIKDWSEKFIDLRYLLAERFGIGNLAYWCRAFSITPPCWELGDKSDLSKYPINDIVKGCKDDVRATHALFLKLNNKKGE